MIMRKVINSLFVIIAAMVTFASCAKQEIETPVVESKTVQFFANSIETKTEFGTPDNGVYPTLWSTGDKVKILVNLESVKDTEKTAEIECSEDFRSAKFTSELVQPDAETFTFYSVSPSVALLGKTAEKLYVTIPSDQTPLETSVDKKAQLLFAMSETTETMPSSVELKYHHLTAYGKLSLANLSSEVSSVSKIKIEAPEDMYLTGKWDYFLAEESLVVRSGTGSNTIVLTTLNTTDIWFACAPVDVSGQTFTLTVTTDKGDFVKEITFPTDRRFEAGRIAKFTVDMDGIEVEQPEDTKTEWVTTSFADLKDGDQVVIVSTKGQNVFAMPNNNGTGAAPGVVAVSYANNKLTSEPETKIIWYVGVEESNRIFYAKSDKSTWAYCTNTNNGVRVGTNTNKTFTLDADTGYLKNTGTSRFLGVYNNQDWRCYTNTTGNTAGQTFQFFVKAGEGSGETPEPELQERNLAFSSTTATATVGEDFTEPTLTGATAGVITYSSSNTSVATVNESTGEVTLVAEGETTITATAAADATYKAGEASYTLIVSAAQGGGEEQSSITVSKTIADIAAANSWENSTQYNTINLNEVITATVTGEGNTGKYYTSGNNWRIYQTESPSLTISASQGYTIDSVKITYSVDKTGVLTYNSSNVTSGTKVDVNASSITFGVGNTGTATNGQVRVTAIEVVYHQAN